MPKFFVENKQIRNDRIEITNSDVNHIKNVLRAYIGDELEICNSSDGKEYRCKIEEIQKELIKCKIIEKLESNVESNIQITILQGIPKAEKMELIIQKSVELGVHDIVPIEKQKTPQSKYTRHVLQSQIKIQNPSPRCLST